MCEISAHHALSEPSNTCLYCRHIHIRAEPVLGVLCSENIPFTWCTTLIMTPPSHHTKGVHAARVVRHEQLYVPPACVPANPEKMPLWNSGRVPGVPVGEQVEQRPLDRVAGVGLFRAREPLDRLAVHLGRHPLARAKTSAKGKGKGWGLRRMIRPLR